MQIINNINTVEVETPDGVVVEVQVAWEVVDTNYPYMDLYLYTEEEWAQETPASLEARQMKQYNEWLAYMESKNG